MNLGLGKGTTFGKYVILKLFNDPLCMDQTPVM